MSENKVTISTETKQYAEVTVNGVSKGKRAINGGPSLTEFVSELAREHGIRTFTVQVNDAPVTSSAASNPVQSGDRVSVSAKDSRGAGAKKAVKTEQASPETPAATEGTQGEAAPATTEAPAEAAPAAEEAAPAATSGEAESS